MPTNSDKFDRRFPTTQWNLVLVAGQGFSRESQDALATLCRTYWYPLYAFVRRQGYAPEEAQDLTQGFFERLLEKHYLRDYQRERGRFRSFLLASLKHFLSNVRDKDRAKKRGGGTTTIALEEMIESGERRFNNEPRSNLTPEKIFEKQWATTVLEKVLSRLGEQTDRFDQLSPYLIGDESRVPYAQLAIKLGTTEGALKVSIHRLRHRFREILRDEIAHTVSDPNEVQEEIRYLMAVVAAPL
jgi:RNA polymerase sigma factor (sigma-70 family)